MKGQLAVQRYPTHPGCAEENHILTSNSVHTKRQANQFAALMFVLLSESLMTVRWRVSTWMAATAHDKSQEWHTA